MGQVSSGFSDQQSNRKESETFAHLMKASFRAPAIRAPVVFLALAVLALTGVAAAAATSHTRWFSDRPVAWDEHDDGDTPAPPAPSHLQELQAALTLRDSVANEADRILSLEGPTSGRDVNALDEVPCSTWFCPRHHLHPMTNDELVAGPALVAPRLPFTVIKGKDLGAASGYQIKDAAGRRFMLKFDVAGHLGMANAGEMIGSRIFHAAGYNVPGAVTVDLTPADLHVAPTATYLLFRVQKRPLTEEHLRNTLSKAAYLPDGRLRAVAVPWIDGTVLGGFDMIGVREGDPNDRIPHQHRRSLRASWVLFAWLSVLDPSSINTLDSYTESGGRHFVRHYFFDFGCSFGSATVYAQGVHQDGEYLVEVGRTLASLFSFGLYRRPFQDRRDEWTRLVRQHPALGYFPAETFDPDNFRTNRKLPTHMRMTDRDAYWGAKLVSAFTDEQLAALVATAGLGAADAAYLEHGLRVRRDIIARRYLGAFAAVEGPRTADDGKRLCFDDLTVSRGYARAQDVTYLLEVDDGAGRRLAAYEQVAVASNTCVSMGGPPAAAAGAGAGAAPGATALTDAAAGYRVITIRTRHRDSAGAVTKATHVHLRWREREGQFVVVGLERDE
jgi:hypothetical protein